MHPFERNGLEGGPAGRQGRDIVDRYGEGQTDEAAAHRLPSPAELRARYPLAPKAVRKIAAQRDTVRRILHGRERRLLVVMGPCSLHDPAAALEYARRLLCLQAEVADRLFLVMRAYCEKPRSGVGWKGLLHDPLSGEAASPARRGMLGLDASRALLTALAGMGVPLAVESLDPVALHYFDDLPVWGAIGARTTESQTHREMASGLPFAVGFKNGCDGGFESAIAGMGAAAARHSRFGIDAEGRAAVFATPGNPDTHLILRGGKSGPNFGAAEVAAARAALAGAGEVGKTGLVVDCSHGNSAKQHRRQIAVALEVVQRIAAGERGVAGVMLESFLSEGRCDWDAGAVLPFGCSITDACLGWEDSRALVLMMAAQMRGGGSGSWGT